MDVEEKRRYRRSDKRRLSSDAKVLVVLMKKQPQKVDELCKNAGIDRSLFYRKRRLLMNQGIVRETGKGYALGSYQDLEAEMDSFLKERRDWGWTEIPLDWLAVQFGRHPSDAEFNRVWPLLFKKYSLMPGPEIKRDAREARKKRGRTWRLG